MSSAEISTEDGRIDFYWRPGCPFCMSLERSLNKLNVPLTKHNIWDRPEAAAFVRSVANGNETVPTVTIGEISMVNPSAREVVSVAAREYPGLIPDDGEEPGRIRNMLRRS